LAILGGHFAFSLTPAYTGTDYPFGPFGISLGAALNTVYFGYIPELY